MCLPIVPSGVPPNCTAALPGVWPRLSEDSGFPYGATRLVSKTRIAIDELKTHWKCAIQRIHRVVNHDGFLVLAPVAVPSQRLSQNRKGAERPNSRDFRVQKRRLRNHRTS